MSKGITNCLKCRLKPLFCVEKKQNVIVKKTKPASLKLLISLFKTKPPSLQL